MSRLIIPDGIEGRYVNDGSDVSIILEDDSERADITFLDMQGEDLGFGWFVSGEDEQGSFEWPFDGPHYFKTVKEAVENAITEFRDVGWWLDKIPQLDKFQAANEKAEGREQKEQKR
jgi:hypothetical protein